MRTSNPLCGLLGGAQSDHVISPSYHSPGLGQSYHPLGQKKSSHSPGSKNPLTPLGQKNTLTFRLISSWSVADILQTEGYWVYLRVSSGGPTLRCSNPPKEIPMMWENQPLQGVHCAQGTSMICMHRGEPPSMHHIHARIVIFRRLTLDSSAMKDKVKRSKGNPDRVFTCLS